MRHRKQIEAFGPFQAIAVRFKIRDIPSKRSRVTGHEYDDPRPGRADQVHDLASGTRARRIEYDDIGRGQTP